MAKRGIADSGSGGLFGFSAATPRDSIDGCETHSLPRLSCCCFWLDLEEKLNRWERSAH